MTSFASVWQTDENPSTPTKSEFNASMSSKKPMAEVLREANQMMPAIHNPPQQHQHHYSPQRQFNVPPYPPPRHTLPPPPASSSQLYPTSQELVSPDVSQIVPLSTTESEKTQKQQKNNENYFLIILLLLVVIIVMVYRCFKELRILCKLVVKDNSTIQDYVLLSHAM